MMEVLKALVLGVIQGLTEFLPVSSSGHLELARVILRDESTAELGLLMSVVLHFGTALATVFVFRKDISSLFSRALARDQKSVNYLLWIIASMIPAALVGLFFDDILDQLFNKNLLLVGGMLLITALLLWFGDRSHQVERALGLKSAIIIGLAQALAILPGISRSGATISMALLLKISREEAARFSFLMVVPLIIGKMSKDVLDGALIAPDIDLLALGAGFIAACISGVLACQWMIKIVQNAQLVYFAIYCALVGSTAIIISQI
jgi:undecaprenyl-diphosphatase